MMRSVFFAASTNIVCFCFFFLLHLYNSSIFFCFSSSGYCSNLNFALSVDLSAFSFVLFYRLLNRWIGCWIRVQLFLLLLFVGDGHDEKEETWTWVLLAFVRFLFVSFKDEILFVDCIFLCEKQLQAFSVSKTSSLSNYMIWWIINCPSRVRLTLFSTNWIIYKIQIIYGDWYWSICVSINNHCQISIAAVDNTKIQNLCC